MIQWTEIKISEFVQEFLLLPGDCATCLQVLLIFFELLE